MKKALFSIIAALAFIASAGAQEAMTSQRYAAKDFTSLSISNAFEVELRIADRYSVTLEYPADCASYISVAKQKATLFIGLKNKTPRKFLSGKHTYRAIIEMPAVYGIYLSGASRLTCAEPMLMNMHPFELHLSGASRVTGLVIEGPSVDIELSGASKAEVNINAAEVEAEVNGASKLTLTGIAGELSLEANGASGINAKNVKAGRVEVDGSGASKLYVYAEQELEVDLSGASKCEYIAPDNVILKKVDVSGASALRRVQ